jgi:hypothetical protein
MNRKAEEGNKDAWLRHLAVLALPVNIGTPPVLKSSSSELQNPSSIGTILRFRLAIAKKSDCLTRIKVIEDLLFSFYGTI